MDGCRFGFARGKQCALVGFVYHFFDGSERMIHQHLARVWFLRRITDEGNTLDAFESPINPGQFTGTIEPIDFIPDKRERDGN